MFPSSAAACRKVCRQVLGSLRRAPLGGSRCDDVVRCRLGHQAGAEHCMVFCAQRHVFWQLQKLNRAASSESDGGQGFGNAPSTWTFDHSARIVHTTPSGNDAPRLQPLTSATETGSLVARRQKLRVSRCACKLAASQSAAAAACRRRRRCLPQLLPPPASPARLQRPSATLPRRSHGGRGARAVGHSSALGAGAGGLHRPAGGCSAAPHLCPTGEGLAMIWSRVCGIGVWERPTCEREQQFSVRLVVNGQPVSGS